MKDGGIEQDPDQIYESVISCIRKLVDESSISTEDIVAVGMDGQMAGVMGVDENFKPVGNYDSWLDTRCENYINTMKQYDEKKIISITGAPVTYAHGPKILWRKNERPEEYNKVAKFVMITTYVAAKLVDLDINDAFIDYTYLHFTGFADINKKEWSSELLNHFGVDENKLPKIVEPWKVIGEIDPKTSLESGLSVGTKIIAGCGDTAATILGAGVVSPGIAIDIAGTASVFSCCVNQYNPDTEYKTLLTSRSVIDGLWTQLAYIGGGGQCLAWFKKDIVNNDNINFDDLNNEAKEIEPGSDGLYFIPHFAGRTCPNNTNVRGAWLNLNWSHNRAHMYKSIMESIAYEYYSYKEIVKRLASRIEIEKVYGVGGGAKSDIFNQIKADVLNCEYLPMERKDSATLACAVIAGYGIGLFNSIEETIRLFVEEGKEFIANQKNVLTYTKFSEKYQKVLLNVEKLYSDI